MEFAEPDRSEGLLLAVDGGGSRTRLWVITPHARLVAEGEAGPSSVTAVGVEGAVRAVADAARRAGLSAPAERDAIAVVACAIAGTEHGPEADNLRKALAPIFPGANIVVEHDAVGALFAGTLGEPGISLLAGTGAICLGLGPDGKRVRAGGWGYLLDDVGSGHWIGREGIRRALRAVDGRGEPTVLTEVIAKAADVDDVTSLVGRIHAGPYDRPWISGLAREVDRAANEGDGVAGEIMDEAAGDLASLVRAVIDRSPSFTGAERVPVIAAGGLFTLGPAWHERVCNALGEQAPSARLAGWAQEPLVGTAFLALRQLHDALPDDVAGRLHELRGCWLKPIRGGPAKR